MPRLTQDQWETIRAEREAGASFRALARKYGVSDVAILKRARAEQWSDGSDVVEVIRKRANEKVSGILSTANPKKKAAAIEAAADRSAEVIRRHQDEPNAARERVYAGLRAHKAAETKEDKILAFEDLKAAKIAAEALSIIQAMERRAWNLEQSATAEIVIKNPRCFDS